MKQLSLSFPRQQNIIEYSKYKSLKNPQFNRQYFICIDGWRCFVWFGMFCSILSWQEELCTQKIKRTGRKGHQQSTIYIYMEAIASRTKWDEVAINLLSRRNKYCDEVVMLVVGWMEWSLVDWIHDMETWNRIILFLHVWRWMINSIDGWMDDISDRLSFGILW